MNKRDFLRSSASAALAAVGGPIVAGAAGGCAAGPASMVKGEAIAVPNSSGTEPPRTPAPAGATDTHIHIFDPRFPRPEGRKGVWATVADYRLFRRRLGLSRCVVVSPGSYGYDNSSLLDALDQFGDTARGVAAVKADVSESELDRLHARGVRGIRLYLSGDHPTAPDQLPQYARRIARRGWHIQLVVGTESGRFVAADKVLMNLECPLVLDHLAYVPHPQGLRHPAADLVRRLLDGGNTHVKLSGSYIVSKAPRPDHVDLDEYVAMLVRQAPERLFWGSDWPHTTAPKPTPDAAALFDLLARWAPGAAVRQRILVENPHRFYWSR